jgi:hypothetical protein
MAGVVGTIGTTKIDEAHVMDVVDTIEQKSQHLSEKGIVQIDDGYQIMDGTWNGNAKFPSGDGLELLVEFVRPV